jgi:hypothetical protein
VAYRTEPKDKKPEGEGPYTKLIAFGTILGVALTYLILAYTVHLPPDGSSNPRPISNPTPTRSSVTPPQVTPTHSQVTPTSSQAANGVPADYQGTWQGDIDYGNGIAQVSMTLGQGADGTQVGEFTLYGRDCQRSVYLEGGQGPISLRLDLTSGSLSECAPFVYASVTSTSSGLYVVMQDTSEVSASEPASAAETGAGTLTLSS